MNRIFLSCFFVALVSCSLAQRGYGGWNEVGQFGANNPVSCGYFFDADNGIIGLGTFSRQDYDFVGSNPLKIYWTNNGSKTWTQAVTPQGGTGRITSIFMKSLLEGYASIYSFQYSLWRTMDGGKTWSDYSQGNNDLLTCVHATSKALTRTIWNGNDGGSSVNNGRTYSQIFTGSNEGSNGIDFADDNIGVVTMGPGGGTWITGNGGVGWQAGDNLPESWSVYALKGTNTFLALPEDADLRFLRGRTVFWSQDGGRNWQTRYSSFSGSLSFTGHIAGIGNTVYVQSDNNANQGLYRSDDLGATWINVAGPSNVRDTRFAVTGCRGEVVYAFDNSGGVWKTTDGGDGGLGFTPRVGDIASVKAGDTTRIPIYIDSTGAAFSINQFSGNFTMNTDLLTPFGFDTIGTLSQKVNFDSIYVMPDGSISFIIKYSAPLKNGIDLSKPIIYIKAAAYLTKTDTTNVNLNSLNINSGALQKSLIVCSITSNIFTLLSECGDSTLRNFMDSGVMPSLLSISPNPSQSGSVQARIYLPSQTDISLIIYDTYGTNKSSKTYGTYNKGTQTLSIGTAGLPSGEYFLKFSTNTGSYFSGRMVIIR